ncbi:MAG: malate dehydrogenase [Candidatus Omnitrophica bacterium]|nr:malate dehydrogenase [Candidatus Omnitrophota bacterium]MDD5546932.1 malate dehydrogenase [Candidatus Omnitrophota bacterium]
MNNLKVAVIGAGQVGGTCAQRIVERKLADVVLVDIAEGLAKGKALDLGQAASTEEYNFKIEGGSDYSLIKGSGAVIVTAGLARKPGMTREDLLVKNAAIVKEAAENIRKYCPGSIIIMVTNPLDIMAYLAYKVSGFESRRVFGMAGVLDTARFKYFIAEKLGVLPSEVEAMVLGGHGDSMVPLVEYTKVKGGPVSELIPEGELKAIIQRTRDGGAEIVSLLKTGSAFYAPSSAVCEMLEAVIKDKNEMFPVSAYLDGQYGIKDLYCGVPARIGEDGVEETVELKLSDKELAALRWSAEQVREGISYLKKSGLV